jgi:hypothetical protein
LQGIFQKLPSLFSARRLSGAVDVEYDFDEMDAWAFLDGYIVPEDPSFPNKDWYKQRYPKKGTEEYENGFKVLIRLLRDRRPFPSSLLEPLANYLEGHHEGRPRDTIRNSMMHEHMWSIFRANGGGSAALDLATKLCAKRFGVTQNWAEEIWSRYQWYRDSMAAE